MLGSVAGWLRVHWLRGAALAVGLALAGGGTFWTAIPVQATGQLIDTAGQPVANALVTAATTLLSPAAQALSDAQGRYRVGMRRWPYGSRRLSVRADGFLPAETAGGRAVLHRWPRVAGQVVDEASAPVPGAVVTVGLLGAAMADLEGRFAVMVPTKGGTLTVAGAGDQHDPATQEVTLRLDETAAVRLTLPRQFAWLHVESDPTGQAPTVDGAPPPDCPATPCDARVLAGAHRLAFGNDLFLPWETVVQADRGATQAVTARLVRKTGTLVVTSPSPGELALDGQGLGGGSWSGQVPTGRHTLTFRAAATWPFVQQVDVAWNQSTQTAVTPVAVATDAPAFTAGLRAYLAAQGGGSYGVYLEELGSGAAIGVGDTTRLEAASVIKVPEAVYLLHQVDAGQLRLDDQVGLRAEDFMGGTGSLFGRARPGDQYTYQQLLALLIQQSDNTAWRALRRLLGDASIDAYSASIGAGDCRQATNWCSARSAGHMMAELARGRLVGAASTRLLLDLLETTIFNDRINWYLPTTTIAHKVGMDGSVRNDCGVVFLAANPFAICVFATVDDTDRGVQVIRDVARAAAWRYAH